MIEVTGKDLKGRLLRQQAIVLWKEFEMSKSDEITKQQLKTVSGKQREGIWC